MPVIAVSLLDSPLPISMVAGFVLTSLLTLTVALAALAVCMPLLLRRTAARVRGEQEAAISGIDHALRRANAALVEEVEQRRKAEQRFGQIIELAPSAMLLVGPDGRITLVNALAEKLFGYQRDELIGQTVDLLVPTARREGHQDHRAGYFGAPRTCAMGEGRELLALRKDGSEFPAEIGLSPLETEEGTLALAAIVDLTSRRLAEEERERFFRISENLLCIAGLDGYFKHINPSFERVLGFSNKEILATPYLELVHPDDLAGVMLEIERIAGGTHTDHYEMRMRCKDGSYRWMLWNASLHGADQIYASGTDITEHRETEQQLLEVKMAAAELAGIRKTAATYAHEINNPLTGVLGYIQLLLDSDIKDPELYGMLEEALEAACRIRDVTLKIEELDHSRTRAHPQGTNLLDLDGYS